MSAADTASWDPNVLPPVGSRPDLVLLANDSMRARRRPLAIAALWGWQTLFALLVALPVTSAVAALYGRHPDGDAPLWQPGALPLMSLGLQEHGARSETVSLFGLVLAVTGFADLVPLGALLASVSFATRDRRAPSFAAAIARGAEAFPTFTSLFLTASLLEGLFAGIGLLLVLIVYPGASARFGDARSDQLAWILTAVLFGFAGVVGVLHDLARAAAIRFRVRALRAWRFGANAFVRAPAPVLWSWAWRALAGWGPVVIAGLVAGRLGGRGGYALLALALVHQGALLIRVALRASWLATAARAVDNAHRVIKKRSTRPTRLTTDES